MALVAPSSPVRRASLAAGAALLAARYQVVHDEALFTATGFLAGDDERRLAELSSALFDPSIRAVLCARGGYGLTRLLPRLDLARLAAHPKPIVAFSDGTALHAALLRAGLVSLHGPVVKQLGTLERGDADRLLALLERPEPPAPWIGLEPLAPGRATGPLVGGNLEVFTRLLGTPFFPPLDGAVLALEEVDEQPYRVDRSLTHLELAGVFARVAAVVVGDFTRCDGREGPPAADVVRERLGRLALPVVAGAPFGHGARNQAFPHGGRVTVDASAASVTFLDPAVS